jgi:hypothetical protein
MDYWNMERGAFWIEPKEPVGKLIFIRLMKNAQVQGARNSL